MSEVYIGVREFRARFSHYLRRAKAGERIVITERGRPVGQLTAPLASLEERSQALIALGIVQWNGERFLPQAPEVANPGPETLADFISEERDANADIL